jgi:hypothetical protein
VTKWEEWERIHAEEDARDLSVILAILTIVVVLVAVAGLSAN